MNSDNQSAAPLYRDAMWAAALGLVANLSLGSVKMAAGILGNSFALVSDAVNSLGDSLTSVVVLAGLWMAQRPADNEHPYGHTRAEAVAASNVTLLVIMSSLYVGWEAVNRLGAEYKPSPTWTLWIAGANVLIKEAFYRYKLGVGKRVGSAAIIASALDHRSDALCSLGVLASLSVVRWGGPAYAWADAVTALVVVAAILWSGGKVLYKCSSEMLDPQADAELVQEIRQAAEAVPGVRAVEKLRVRKTGLEHLADIHIEVDPAISVEEGHRIGHRVKDRLVERFASLRDVLVHLEPHPHE